MLLHLLGQVLTGSMRESTWLILSTSATCTSSRHQSTSCNAKQTRIPCLIPTTFLSFLLSDDDDDDDEGVIIILPTWILDGSLVVTAGNTSRCMAASYRPTFHSLPVLFHFQDACRTGVVYFILLYPFTTQPTIQNPKALEPTTPPPSAYSMILRPLYITYLQEKKVDPSPAVPTDLSPLLPKMTVPKQNECRPCILHFPFPISLPKVSRFPSRNEIQCRTGPCLASPRPAIPCLAMPMPCLAFNLVFRQPAAVLSRLSPGRSRGADMVGVAVSNRNWNSKRNRNRNSVLLFQD